MTRLILGTLLVLGCGTRDEATVRLGSKKFTESVVLGELAVQRLRAEGIAATHQRELGGSRILFEAVLRGDLDAYPEYTGTIRRELLPELAEASDEAVRAALAERSLALTAPLGFQNTYAIGMKRERAAELGIRTLSQLAARGDLNLGFTAEFMHRGDGWPSLRQRYAFRAESARGMDHDLAYRALEAGEIDATDLYSTDAEIQQYDLVALEDDLKHFPEYAAVFLHRANLREPARAGIASLAGTISEQEMVVMNATVKLGGKTESEAASDFLQEKLGLEAAPMESSGRIERIATRTAEHLLLVGVSLAIALLLGLPLGILAAGRRRAGQLLLGGAGIIQTIPSLALLVALIPLLGIGAAPAIVALFLYSLLPILRGTHAGLTMIPEPLRDSADALGLSARTQLLRIELPLALPSVLGGIKTAAVINVGTATLGALIGAGGYGQPILTGIRLASTPLILEGAIPAAVLALLVQGAFDLLERALSAAEPGVATK